MRGTNVPVFTEYQGQYQLAEYPFREQRWTVWGVKDQRVYYFAQTKQEALLWIRRRQAMLRNPTLLEDTMEGLAQLKAGQGRKVTRRPKAQA